MTPLQNQNVPSQVPRSSGELDDEIRAIIDRLPVAMSSFPSLNTVLGSGRQLGDRAITPLPEEMGIMLGARRTLIRIILEMPPEERVDFARSILELIPQIDQDTKNAFVETVAANLGDDEGQLVKNILPFVTTEMCSSKNIAIIQAISDLSVKDERKEVIKSSQRLINPRMSEEEIAAIIRKVAKIPANEREEVIGCSQRLVTPGMSEEEIAAIIWIVVDIPEYEREEVIGFSQRLITPGMSEEEIAAIIWAVVDVPEDEREEVIEYSQRLITPEMLADEIAAMIQVVVDIPEGERWEVIECSELLITLEMSAGTIAKIIQAVARIPANKREGVIVSSHLLIISEMSAGEIAAIIRKVAKIPANEREEVVRSSQWLITPKMSAGTIAKIIQAVFDVPANEREKVIGCSQRLITPGMSAEEIAAIIWTVAGIPVNEREEVIEVSQRLITPEMSAGTIAAIIWAVVDVPANEREEVIEGSQRLITPEMSAEEIAAIIQAVTDIPANERARIIPGIAILPADERREAIRNAALPFRNAAPPLLYEGMDVHANDRDPRTKAAIELLFEHQKHITPSEINEAKDSFIAYLEEASIDETKKTLAKSALLEPRKNNLDFGPFITDEGFTFLGLPISGADLIGRLWIFISHLAEEEQTNATTGMISALIDSYSEPDVRVCNQGKMQRLIVAVLQGRLAGIDIEGDDVPVSTSVAISVFFNIEAHQKIDTLKDLMEAANRFCDEHTLVNKDSFIAEIEDYARQQGIEN